MCPSSWLRLSSHRSHVTVCIVVDPFVVNSSESLYRIAQPINATVSAFLSTADSNQQKLLLDELLRNVVVLTCESTAESGVCDVYLVGTSHISQESCGERQQINNFLKPQVVFLELCPARSTILPLKI